jgi:hypothetical protein
MHSKILFNQAIGWGFYQPAKFELAMIFEGYLLKLKWCFPVHPHEVLFIRGNIASWLKHRHDKDSTNFPQGPATSTSRVYRDEQTSSELSSFIR